MNRLFYYIIILCLISVQGFTQWYWEYPIPQGNNLNDLVILEGSNLDQGYAIGDKGYILKTVDPEYLSWSIMNSGVDVNLYDIAINSLNEALVVGNDGTILKRNSSLLSWDKMTSNTLFTLKGVTWVNDDLAFAVGSDGIVLKYENNIWLPMITGSYNSLNTVCFINDTTGIAAGFSGSIMRTEDGGESWNVHIPDSSLVFNAIDFPSENIGYLVGNKGVIVKTENAGLSWNKISPDTIIFNYNTVRFFNDTIGYVAGDNGQVYYTRDGGKIWSKNLPFVDMRINAMYHRDVNSALGELLVAGENGIILKSEQWGEWDNVTNGSFDNLVSLIYYNDTSILSFGGYPYTNSPLVLRYHYVLDTITNEKSLIWEPDTSNFKNLNHYITDVFYREYDTLWVSDSVWVNDTIFIHDTTFTILDGIGFLTGKTGGLYVMDRDSICIQIESGTNKSLYAVSAYRKLVDTTTTYVAFSVGTSGTLSKVTLFDTIQQKEILDSETTNNLFGISMPGHDKDGYAVGENGTLLRIRNEGNNISKIPTGYPSAFYDIELVSETSGFMVGAYGIISKFEIINDQFIFETINSSVTTPLVDIHFQDELTGYIVGDNGVILKTIDGGQEWRKLYSPTNNHLKCIDFKNNEIGYISGYGSTILKSINAGGPFIPVPLVFETIQKPFEFSLYPNPTVNEISLDYILSDKQNVRITIYDLSGRKIEEVLNQSQGAGKQISSHQVGHLNKGIYIITLQVGRQVSAKKMVILR